MADNIDEKVNAPQKQPINDASKQPSEQSPTIFGVKMNNQIDEADEKVDNDEYS